MKQKEMYFSPELWAVDAGSVNPICESVLCNTITDVVEENVEW